MENASSQKHIILLHGLSHGGWCWYKVATKLRLAGHRVTAPDLAAAGIDETRLRDVPTFADYTRPLLDILGSLPPGERVILVGHSLGGLNIALAVDRFPEKIAAAVFLTAFMPDTASAPSFALAKLTLGGPMSYWMDTQLTFEKGEEKPPTSLLFGPEFMASKLYQLCQPEDLTLGKSLVRVGSLFLEDLSSMQPFSKDRYGLVDKVYIVCSQDLAIPEEFQRWMIENNPVGEVKTIKGADHMAMLSAPEELGHCLLDIAQSYA